LIVAAQEEVLYSIYVQVLPSVVQIEISRLSDGGGQGFGPFNFGGDDAGQELIPGGEGSGFIWDADGHIVTNWHVVDGAEEITVLFEDGLELKAALLGSDKDSDLAVLKASLPSDRYVPVMKGDSDLVRVGQLVVAIGDPFGQEFTLTSGIVSAVGRTIRGGTAFSIPEVIQTDAAINPGNSGGPLLDRTGRVIGINSQIISRSGSNAGVGFAIPINVAKRVVPALIADGRYDYAYLGISGVTLRADAAEEIGLARDTRGALLIEVTDGTPAAEAGLIGSDENFDSRDSLPPLGGDVITAINGTQVRTVGDVIAFIAGGPRPGDRVVLTILRDGEVLEIQLTLGTRPASAN
jgi:S1-C subfamily serine protease